jgi:thiol-disulfide isomerase/thioredoxin
MTTKQALLAAMAVLLIASFSTVEASPSIGEAAPDVLGTDLEGETVSLANYTGRPVVISFWATWCPYCLKELPILEGIQRSAGKQNIQVIAINTESREVFRKAAKALSQLTLKFSHDTGKKGSDAFGVKGIPHMVIIGRDSKIIRIYRGYDESSLDGIVADINTALAPPR